MEHRRRRTRRSAIRRRKRRMKIAFGVLFVAFLGVVAGVLIHAALPYKTIDLDNYFTLNYGGYNTNGTAEAVLDETAVDSLLAEVKEDYENSHIHYSQVDAEDYVNFRSSLSATVSPSVGLSNGSVVTVTCHCDEALAKKLKIDVDGYTKQITVNSLMRATTISNDQLFEDVEVTFVGVSPNLTMGVTNTSEHPFLKTVTYEIVDAKDNYAEGDEVELRAVFDPQAALDMQYVVDENASCSYTYTATATSSYVSSASDISSDIIQEAVSAGAKAFTNANEYGVRIFCEGNLVPVYINKQATFVWGSPRALSAYFKVAYADEAGKLGTNYNDLDIIYECNISQADGVNCSAYCVVRFSNFIKNEDGSISYDFSNPSIMSASYYSARVKKNVVDSYTGKCEIDKVL